MAPVGLVHAGCLRVDDAVGARGPGPEGRVAAGVAQPDNHGPAAKRRLQHLEQDERDLDDHRTEPVVFRASVAYHGSPPCVMPVRRAALTMTAKDMLESLNSCCTMLGCSLTCRRGILDLVLLDVEKIWLVAPEPVAAGLVGFCKAAAPPRPVRRRRRPVRPRYWTPCSVETLFGRSTFGSWRVLATHSTRVSSTTCWIIVLTRDIYIWCEKSERNKHKDRQCSRRLGELDLHNCTYTEPHD